MKPRKLFEKHRDIEWTLTEDEIDELESQHAHDLAQAEREGRLEVIAELRAWHDRVKRKGPCDESCKFWEDELDRLATLKEGEDD